MVKTSITVVLRRDKADSQGFCPLAIRVIVDRKPTYKSIGHKVHPDQWNEEAKEVSKKVTNHLLINGDIKRELAATQARLLEHKLAGNDMSQHTVKKLAQGESDGNFISYLEEWLERSKKTHKPGTLRHMNMDARKFKQFSGGSIHYSQVTPKFLEEYQYWLVNTQDLAHNTAWRCLKLLRTVFNAARKDGATKHYPFAHFKLKYVDKIKGWLERSEVEAIYNAANKPELDATLQLVGWYFCLGCYTGLRFGDLQRVFTGELVRGDRFVVATSKTGEIVSIPLTTRLRSLLEKIGTKPIISNQKSNDYIKILGAVAGITQPERLHFHLARHSFATLSLELGIPVTSVQAILGHRSIRTTAIYAKVTNSLLTEAMDKWEQTHKK